MKKTLLVFGNITFENGDAIIHEVTHTLIVDRDDAEIIGEELCNIFLAYVIPATFSGNIIWE